MSYNNICPYDGRFLSSWHRQDRGRSIPEGRHKDTYLRMPTSWSLYILVIAYLIRSILFIFIPLKEIHLVILDIGLRWRELLQINRMKWQIWFRQPQTVTSNFIHYKKDLQYVVENITKAVACWNNQTERVSTKWRSKISQQWINKC